LGEGALWNPKTQELLWIDIMGKRVFFYNPSSADNRTFPVSHYIGAAVPKEDGGLAVAMQNGFCLIDAKTVGTATSSKSAPAPLVIPQPVGDPESHLPQNRFNDGKAGPDGKFYAGTMSIKEEKEKGAFYSLDNDLKVKKHFGDVSISNGVVWTKDTKTFYYVDTMAAKVDSFDFDIKKGELSNRRTAFTVPKDYGWPDGTTIDNEDNLWIAHWEGSRITRWNPRTGKLLLTIPIPAARITSLAFGGPKLNDIYVTSASIGVDRSKDPLAGSLFVIKNTPFTGVPAHFFKQNPKHKL